MEDSSRGCAGLHIPPSSTLGHVDLGRRIFSCLLPWPPPHHTALLLSRITYSAFRKSTCSRVAFFDHVHQSTKTPSRCLTRREPEQFLVKFSAIFCVHSGRIPHRLRLRILWRVRRKMVGLLVFCLISFVSCGFDDFECMRACFLTTLYIM